MGNICCPEKEPEGFRSSGHRLGNAIEGPKGSEPRTVIIHAEGDKIGPTSGTLGGAEAGGAPMDDEMREKLLQAAAARAKKNEPKKKPIIYANPRKSDDSKTNVDVKDWMS